VAHPAFDPFFLWLRPGLKKGLMCLIVPGPMKFQISHDPVSKMQ